jgi:hypothetical protein
MMQLSRLKSISPVALLVCSLTLFMLIAGCGDTNSPQATVEDIVRAVRTGETKTVLSRFEDPNNLYFFEEALPDACAPAIGAVKMTGEDSATVVVLLNPIRADAGGFTFVMRKSGDSWRVTQVQINEGS